MSLVDEACAKIKKRILNNVYKPGFQAFEQELADKLGMSRTPVREACIRLEREGLIQCAPRRGMRVIPLSPADMRETYEVLTCLEALAAERLANRKPSASELAPLSEAMEAMDAALADDNLAAWAKADALYHRTLLRLAGNRQLETAVLTFRDQVYRARLSTLHLRPKPSRSNREHRQVLNAIRKGDGPRARELHQQHGERAREVLIDILDEAKLPGP